MDELNLPVPIKAPVLKSAPDKPYAEEIKSDIQACTKDLASISRMATSIQSQGSWEGWWNSGDNMRLLASTVSQTASVQQRTINMVVLLMAAAGRMKSDYNVIMDSIEDLSRAHSGSVEVLEYLVKVKQTVESIKRRDELLESLITYTNDLRQCLSELDQGLRPQLADLGTGISELGKRQEELGGLLTSLQGGLAQQVRAVPEAMDLVSRSELEQRTKLRNELLATLDQERQERRETEAELRLQIEGRSRWPKVVLWSLVVLSLGFGLAALVLSIR